MKKLIKKGDVWKIRSRGFSGVIKSLETFDASKDVFFDAIILDGTKSYMSRNRYQETAGDKISFRSSLTEFVERIDKKGKTKYVGKSEHHPFDDVGKITSRRARV